jgi:hypothetical protein
MCTVLLPPGVNPIAFNEYHYHTVQCNDPIQSSSEFLKVCLYTEHGQELCSLLYLLFECQAKNRARCGTSSFSQLLVGIDLLTVEASRSHSDTPQSVGLLWTSDQPFAETSTWQHTQLSQQTDIHALGGIQNRNPRKRTTAEPQLLFFLRDTNLAFVITVKTAEQILGVWDLEQLY